LNNVPVPRTRAAFCSVKVLPPSSVTSLLMKRSVKLPVEFSRRLPVLMMLPLKVVSVPLFAMKLPVFVANSAWRLRCSESCRCLASRACRRSQTRRR
jgi:hypothetical protein